jgi:membrane-bound lytic murein transglycosylase D
MFCCCFALSNAIASDSTTVWDVIRSQLSMNHEVDQPEVQSQIRWLMSHRGYLQNLSRAEPYIYHIVTEVRKRKLPGELALLPMLESAYNPFAYSGVGAAGIWQLMPGTGSDLGLKQDWWYDGRRSIRPSTDAALNFLTYLNKAFNGNWLLAIAAYDSGEGTVSRAITSSGQYNKINFWTLPLPAETKAYVPRLLALAEIIKNPQRYQVRLPDIPHVPYFEEVNIGSQIDLSHAARLAGMSYKDLIKLNPGYNRWATAPYKPFKLLIPKSKVANFNRNLSQVPHEKRISWDRHQVRSGDTLGSIANRYFTTVKLIRELNQLKSDNLKSGQFILIPSMKNAPTAAPKRPSTPIPDHPPTIQTYKVIHIVQATDTFAVLEKKYQVTGQKIREWNQLEATAPLNKGQQLIVWRNTVKPGLYTVVKGDNLGNVAKRYGTTVASLLKLNPGLHSKILSPGQRINIG